MSTTEKLLICRAAILMTYIIPIILSHTVFDLFRSSLLFNELSLYEVSDFKQPNECVSLLENDCHSAYIKGPLDSVTRLIRSTCCTPEKGVLSKA